MPVTRIARRTRAVRPVALAVACLLALAGCADTVAGSAVGMGSVPVAPTTPTGPDTPGSDTDTAGQVTGLPVDPATSEPNASTAPSVTAPDTTAPDTTGPDTTGPDTTGPDTTAGGSPSDSSGSLPPIPSAITVPSTDAPPVEDKKGVPPEDPGLLRKDIDEQAGVLFGDASDPAFTFKVVEIDPAFGPRCNGSDKSAKGNLIGVKISYSVEKSFADLQDAGEIGFDYDLFGVRDADGRAYRGLGTAHAQACRIKSPLPQTPLQGGDKGTGWIVLDSPIRYGTITLTQAQLDGGWEWIIPGSDG